MSTASSVKKPKNTVIDELVSEQLDSEGLMTPQETNDNLTTSDRFHGEDLTQIKQQETENLARKRIMSNREEGKDLTAPINKKTSCEQRILRGAYADVCDLDDTDKENAINKRSCKVAITPRLSSSLVPPVKRVFDTRVGPRLLRKEVLKSD